MSIEHELKHTCGFEHAAGGVVNPSLTNGLPAEWLLSDPLALAASVQSTCKEGIDDERSKSKAADSR